MKDPVIEEAVSNALKELAAQIDWEVMVGFYLENGWTKVERSPFVSNNEAVDIKVWIDESCNGKVASRGRVWVFEQAHEATMFILKFGK